MGVGEAAMGEPIAAPPKPMLAAALRADPEAGNLRFPVIPPFLLRVLAEGAGLGPGVGTPI